jgi:hypothetical protein
MLGGSTSGDAPPDARGGVLGGVSRWDDILFYY